MVLKDAKNRLLVEGKDDQYTVINLMANRGVDWDTPDEWAPYVHACGGYEGLLEALRVSPKTYERLGIVVDADLRPEERFRAIRDSLRRQDLAPPDVLNPNGVLFEGLSAEKRVGIWVMPDNEAHGMLEDFIAALVPDDDPCWEYACEAAVEAKRKGAPYPESAAAKAQAHTWLAWQAEPGLPFGTAIKARYFDANHDLAQRFAEWFTRLFRHTS